MFPSGIRDKMLGRALKAARRLFDAGYIDESMALLAEIAAAFAHSRSLLPLVDESGFGLDRFAPTAGRFLTSRPKTRYLADVARAVATVEAVPTLPQEFDWQEILLPKFDLNVLANQGLKLLQMGHVEGLALLGTRFGRRQEKMPFQLVEEAILGLPRRPNVSRPDRASSILAETAYGFQDAGDVEAAVRIGSIAPALFVSDAANQNLVHMWHELYWQPAVRLSKSERDAALKTGLALLEKGYGPDATRLQLDLLRPKSVDWRTLWKPVEQAIRSTPKPQPPTSPPGPGERKIIVTGHDEREALVTTFLPQKPYMLRFRVGAPVAGNLATGDTDVTVPSSGLKARWVVASTTVDFVAVSTGTVLHLGDTWLAEFDLDIPGQGESDVVTLSIRTRDRIGEIDLTILAGAEPYRRLSVKLDAGALVHHDVVAVNLRHTNLRTTHEWTTPPERIVINVIGEVACVDTAEGKKYPRMGWVGTKTNLNNSVNLVRGALDKLRQSWDAHLNNIDQADLERRLAGRQWFNDIHPGVGWSQLANQANPEYVEAFDQLAPGDELFGLAQQGYRLFNTCFPEENPLRKILTDLMPGSRVDFNWPERGAKDWISHVPWGLMYLDPPQMGKPIDLERFLGLRLRIGSTSWEPKQQPSGALGEPGQTNLLHFLYWGTSENDEIAVQSAWQRSAFAKWGRQHFVPSDPAAADRKTQVIKALETPEPNPTVVLYLYCECSVSDGSNPLLQFGDSPQVPNVVGPGELPQGPLKTGPLVFANACTTVASDPKGTNELEETFFHRNIRAFVGTETKVPVKLASRFGWLFFQFFLRNADPERKPMAAGEALAQARLFLWTQYRNPGGLFYCLVNQYDLYLASDHEVSDMQRPLEMRA